MKSRKGMNIFLVELPVGVGPGSSGRFVLVRQLLEDENFRAPVTKKKKKKDNMEKERQRSRRLSSLDGLQTKPQSV